MFIGIHYTPLATSLLKLPFFTFEITRPAPHTLVGYPPLPECLPKLLGTRESLQRETGHMNYDQPAIDIYPKAYFGVKYI